MDRDAARIYVREQLPEYLREKGIDPDSRKNFRCLNPDHEDDTPSMTYNRDKQTVHCFGCGANYDIIDLIGIDYGIYDDKEKFNKAYELYGLDVSSQKKPAPAVQPPKKVEAKPLPAKQKNDYSAYFSDCEKNRGAFTYLAQRGISEKTAAEARLGYDLDYRNGTGGETWTALIIPTSKGSYVARNIKPGPKENRYRKMGENAIYMIERLKASTGVFIVEGELDALSIVEAGGQAVALGSTSNVNRFVKYLEDHEKERPIQPLLIAMDNDDAGKKAEKELANGLSKIGVKYVHYNPAEELGSKDANEALMAHRDKFSEIVKKADDVESLIRQKEQEEYEKNSVANHIQDFINGIAESVNTPSISTGFRLLDESLGSGLYEGLYVIGAISSLGKTTFVQQLVDQAVSVSGAEALIFSLEMSRSEMMAKSISRFTIMGCNGATGNAKTVRGITDGKRWGNYSNEEKRLIQSSIQEYGKIAKNIYITEGLGDIGVEQIRDTVERHVRVTGKRPIVVVDYIQILSPADPRSTDKQNTDKAVMELKRISRDYKIPVIGISSFNRENYSNEVSMVAFKESGAIEYSSDVLIGLQFKGAGKANGKNDQATEAKKKDPREIELVILKNRNGRVGDKIEYKYYPKFNYFIEGNYSEK